jgi:DNA-binding transcriptional regulator YiaG
MDCHEVRRQRQALGYSVPLLAELLRVDPRQVRDWETGATPIPDWLTVSMAALVKARHVRQDDDLLTASGTFASRRRTLLRSKVRG